MEIAVKDAARRLSVNEPRVRQLLAAGDLAGRRVGRFWLVDAEDVARLQQQRRLGGRPLGPLRAWGLLDLLSGGDAPWLTDSARSQLRSSLIKYTDADADRWRSALRHRSWAMRCQIHPSALVRLLKQETVLPAGLSLAQKRGFDLLAAVPTGGDSGVGERSAKEIAQVYVKPDRWSGLAQTLAVRVEDPPNLIVLQPKLVWPFEGRSELPDAALAADLLDAAEPRAISAGARRLNEQLAGVLR